MLRAKESTKALTIHPSATKKEKPIGGSPNPDVRVNPAEEAVDCEIIISKPNPLQTDLLRIKYNPCHVFDSSDVYPIVCCPPSNALLKLPREGRSDVKGFKEPEFLAQIKASLFGISVADDVHLKIPGRDIPYEPDIVLYDEDINLYIDVEIDEPYDGYTRLVTHYTESKDTIRDLFFKESGWVVVRFTEKQVHQACSHCIQILEDIVSAMRGAKPIQPLIEKENRWSRRQAIQWEKDLYREKYLGIQFFSRQVRTRKVVCLDKAEGIDLMIRRTPLHIDSEKPSCGFKTSNLPSSLAFVNPSPLCFDEQTHSYFFPGDATGNSDRISVTTLIERFFPTFDEEEYIKKRMEETGMTELEVRRELAEPSERGTDMHKQIELFLKGQHYDGSSKEFKLFLRFYEEQIVRRGLVFDSAEYPIELKGSNIAGTIDALFRKPDGDYVMVDWKRSKHLIIDGYPKKYGFGRGLSVLAHLDNSSYYKYELQQSFYKYILEKDYGINVSSMILAVLHPEYDRYFTVRLSEYRKKEVLNMIESYEYTI